MASELITPGLLVIVSGPSGAGKDEVVRRARESLPGMEMVVTCTNRPKRSGEFDGRDYHFLSTQTMEQLIRAGKFLEFTTYRTHPDGSKDYKGTLPDCILPPLLAGQDLFWRIDPNAAAHMEGILREQVPAHAPLILRHSLTAYIGVDHLRDLPRRRQNRDHLSTACEEIMKDLRDDWRVWCQNETFFRRHHVLINRRGCLDNTVAQLVGIIARKKFELNQLPQAALFPDFTPFVRG